MEVRATDEFGDFQTPQVLADDICQFLVKRGVAPGAILEPTCGLGAFVISALQHFPSVDCLGIEINADYVHRLTETVTGQSRHPQCRIVNRSFFDVDWPATLNGLRPPILMLGNPPWVTNSELGVLASPNLPAKSNFQGHVGLDGVTGKSNFDISEWMMIRLLEMLAGNRGWLAMLCKTAVARKVMAYVWRNEIPIDWAEIRSIDAKASFRAAVDACLFVAAVDPNGSSRECNVYPSLTARSSSTVLGWSDEHLIADVRAFHKWKHLAGNGPYQWRSGVKHDCAKVMELRKEASRFRNGLGDLVELEDELMFPMLKSSEIANESPDAKRWMLVPQRHVGEDTRTIQLRAPKTWQYLTRHREALDRRRSSIYRKRPQFSVFGVGPYTFAPWKVAISGFYKRLKFTVVGGKDGKPTVLDDTVYFLVCQCEQEAKLLVELLNSRVAEEFYSGFLFWDAKRPITVDLLRRLNLQALARELGKGDEFDDFLGKTSDCNQNRFAS